MLRARDGFAGGPLATGDRVGAVCAGDRRHFSASEGSSAARLPPYSVLEGSCLMRPRSSIWSCSLLALAGVAIDVGASPAGADFVAYATPAGANPPGGGGPVSATAQF